jgi:Trypsin-like peptidase domain
VVDLQPIPKPAKNNPNEKTKPPIVLPPGYEDAKPVSRNNEGRFDIPSISQKAAGAVVLITMYKDKQPIAQGSGFIVGADGEVVTNYHVIKNGTSAVVKFPDATHFDVDGVLASDRNRDIAIIKVQGDGFHTLTLGDSQALKIGEEIVAIGSPLSLESTVSNGIVSGIRPADDEGNELIQITAPISPGSSGGPLFNMYGKVVGITAAHLAGGQNLNFAIPINEVKVLLATKTSKSSNLPDEPDSDSGGETNGPSLAETLQWMKNSECIEDHTSLDSCMYIFPTSCQDFGMFIDVYRSPDLQAAHFAFTFDLGDIDPESVSQEGGIVHFRVTDDQKKINFARSVAKDEDHFRSDHLISSDHFLTNKGDFFAGDEDYAKRLAKAFKHAVVLCGGKPSTF